MAPVIAYFFPAELEETPSEPGSVGKVDDLPEGESPSKVPFGRYPAIVIHTKEGVKAYSAVCTHFACICKWDAERWVRSFAPAMKATLTPLMVSVISGPPPTPLVSPAM